MDAEPDISSIGPGKINHGIGRILRISGQASMGPPRYLTYPIDWQDMEKRINNEALIRELVGDLRVYETRNDGSSCFIVRRVPRASGFQ